MSAYRGYYYSVFCKKSRSVYGYQNNYILLYKKALSDISDEHRVTSTLSLDSSSEEKVFHNTNISCFF